MKTFWIILCVLLGLGILAAGYYFFFSDTAKRKKEIARILSAKLTYARPIGNGHGKVSEPYKEIDLINKTLDQLIAIK